MASALQKLLRKSPAPRIIAALQSSQALNPLEPLFRAPLHRSPFVEIRRECHRASHPSSPATEAERLFSSPHFGVIYPSFPFGFALNPISATGFLSVEAEEDAALELDDDDSHALWADSVKKKRKGKMNKHKYKKLRRRMRRQT